MISIEQVQGALFDLDDTLLDNGPVDKPELWTHSRSRLAAIHAVAAAHGVDELSTVTPKESTDAFMTSPVHSLRGSIWNILHMKGLTGNNTGAGADPHLMALVEEIITEKNRVHEDILLEFGVEVPGATQFVKDLAARG
ncbi:MAG TPA: hypothetical protein VD735_04135, partial [Candidatus Saccharimonadales bacterium]|nr:hypothetical protein [Candidatus Saccharimonadales bacterium]